MFDSDKVSKILQLVAVIASAVIVIWQNNRKRDAELAKERLEKVYHPLFVKLEKYLYRYESFSEDKDFWCKISACYAIVSSNRLIVSTYFYLLFYRFMEEDKCKKDKIFIELSEALVDGYSSMRKQLGLGGIGIQYREKKKLFKSPLSMRVKKAGDILEVLYYLLASTVFALFIASFIINVIMYFYT